MKGAEQCPRCGGAMSLRVQLRNESATACCWKCDTQWEPFDPADLAVPDSETSSFKEPCDNCAFRKGSPERADPDEWRRLMADIRAGAVFFCHKGVPVSKDPNQSHDHPKRPDGSYDTDRMRTCTGYIVARLRDMRSTIKRSKRCV